MRLILFDIDGTLLTAHGAGRRALGRALLAVYGTTGAIEAYDFRGKTDPRIVVDLMTGAGADAADVRARFDECFEAYARALTEEIGDGRRVVLLPGAGDLVRRLERQTDVVLGLVTGNIEEGARIKLVPTGLWECFRTGAYGSDHADRLRLPALAARRAHALVGYPFSPDEVVVLGDTPLDVECARAFGARAVAVATGQYSREQLTAEGADLVLESLGEVDAVMAALLAR